MARHRPESLSRSLITAIRLQSRGVNPVYVYEGRTIRGLGLVAWALLIQLGAVVAMGVALAALALLLEPALLDPTAFVTPFFGILAAVCGIEIAEAAMAGVFLVGFYQLHAGRNEYGLSHAESIDRALLCLILVAVVSVAWTGYTFAADFLGPPVPTTPAEPLLVGNLLVAPLAAAFAGLTLFFCGKAIADAPLARRLRTALLLGVLGAAAGPTLLALATAANTVDVSAMSSGLLAAAVAGNGMSALSLLTFVLAFRAIQQDLVEGRPAPSLPRIEQVYAAPWSGQVPQPPPTPPRVP